MKYFKLRTETFQSNIPMQMMTGWSLTMHTYLLAITQQASDERMQAGTTKYSNLTLTKVIQKSPPKDILLSPGYIYSVY